MNKIFLLIMLVFILPVQAAPIIENLQVSPQNAYLRENIIVSFRCFSSNNAIQETKLYINGPGVIIPAIRINGGPEYSFTLDRAYIDRIGSFQAVVSCRDGEAELNQTTQFLVSDISGGIKQVLPQQVYAGDLIEAIFDLQKNNASLSADVNFSFYIDGQEAFMKSTVFDTSKGWIIRFDAPATTGSHKIKIIAMTDRVILPSDYTISVKNPLEFYVLSVDKTSVRAGDNVTLVFSANDKGNFLSLDNMKVYFGNSEVTREITTDGKLSYVKIAIPDILPKSYTIRADLNYNGYTYQAFKNIDFVVPIRGELIDSEKAVNAEIRFLKSTGEQLKLSTDSSGNYYSTIIPGTYDIEITFDASKMTLLDVSVDSLDDAFDYSYSEVKGIPGVRNGKTHYYSSSVQFSKALIEIPYKENELDEVSLKVFKCTSWIADKKECKTSWVEINANIDKIKNAVTISTASLGAFAIGSREKITVNYNIGKKSYNVKDVIRIRGTTQDYSRTPIPYAKIAVRMGSNEVGNLTSDNNGIFSVEFMAPDIEGNHSITVYADKLPYMRGEKTDSFEIKKVRSLSIVFPDSLRLAPGSNATKEIVIINIGQEDMHDMELELSGVPYDIDLSQQKFDVPVNGQQKILVTFYIPEDAQEATNAGEIKLHNSVFLKEKTLGFTVEKQIEATEKQENANPLTGFAFDFAMPSLQIPQLGSVIYLAVFGAASMAGAFVLRKFRRRKETQHHMTMLSDIKNHMKSKEKKKNS